MKKLIFPELDATLLTVLETATGATSDIGEHYIFIWRTRRVHDTQNAINYSYKRKFITKFSIHSHTN